MTILKKWLIFNVFILPHRISTAIMQPVGTNHLRAKFKLCFHCITKNVDQGEARHALDNAKSLSNQRIWWELS